MAAKKKYPRRYTGTQHGYLTLRRRSYKKWKSLSEIDRALTSGKTKQGYLYSADMLEKMAFRRDILQKQKNKIDKALRALTPVVYDDQVANRRLSGKGKNRHPLKNIIRDKNLKSHNKYVQEIKRRYEK